MYKRVLRNACTTNNASSIMNITHCPCGDLDGMESYGHSVESCVRSAMMK